MTDCDVDSRAADALCEAHHREFFFCLRERLKEVNEQAAANQERYVTEISRMKKHMKELVDGIVNSPTKHEKLVIEAHDNQEWAGAHARIEELTRAVEAVRGQMSRTRIDQGHGDRYEFCTGCGQEGGRHEPECSWTLVDAALKSPCTCGFPGIAPSQYHSDKCALNKTRHQYHSDANCGSCDGALEVERDAICKTCAPDPVGPGWDPRGIARRIVEEVCRIKGEDVVGRQFSVALSYCKALYESARRAP
jgi:hypothetical protein